MSFLAQAALIALVSSYFRYLGGWPSMFTTTVTMYTWSWLLGLICGDAAQGLMLGAMVQTINLVPVYVGGITTMDLWFSTTLVVPLVLISGLDTTAAVAIAAPLAVVANMVLQNMHQIIVQDMILAPWVLREANKGNYKQMTRIVHIFAPILNVAYNFVFTFAAVYAGTSVADALLAKIPESLMLGFNACIGLLPTIGMAMFLTMLGKVKFLPYYLVGFLVFYFAGQYLPMMAIAMIGIALAGIFMLNKSDDEGFTAVGGAN